MGFMIQKLTMLADQEFTATTSDSNEVFWYENGE